MPASTISPPLNQLTHRFGRGDSWRTTYIHTVVLVQDMQTIDVGIHDAISA
jgi:hypothetical protein